MPLIISQSAIAELRDQLCLDYADGQYLNAVSANLGMTRPLFGFSDATWRAIVKIIALQYKQVGTKFEQALAVLIGPKVTQCSSFAVDCVAGDQTAILVGTEQFPQVGTMLIDATMATEETIAYEYIDRYTNTVYFTTPLVFSHVAINAEWETGVIGSAVASNVDRVLFDTSGLPNPTVTGDEYPVCIGRGTPYEYVDILTDISDLPARQVTLTTGASVDHPGVTTAPGSFVLSDTLSTQSNALYVSVPDTSLLSRDEGYLQGDVEGDLTVTDTGTTSSLVMAASVFTAMAYTGFFVRFAGNVTAALAGAVAEITSNTDTTLVFSTTLPDAPVAGDTCTLLANFQYLTAEDSEVLLQSELPDLMTFAGLTKFSLIKASTTLAIAQVQVLAGGWDIFQSDERHVEILLPVDLLENDLRTASYLHNDIIMGESPAGTAVVEFESLVGSTEIYVLETKRLPVFGILEHTEGAIRYAYYVPHTCLTREALAGDTTITVANTALFLSTGGLALSLAGFEIGAFTIIDDTTIGVPALPFDYDRGTAVLDCRIIRLSKETTVLVSIGHNITWYAYQESGNIWGAIDDLWPGPYVWDGVSPIHKSPTVPDNTVTTNLSGPKKLSVDTLAGGNVFEVEDASAFPDTPPYSVTVGENSGNLETLTVTALALKQRTYTTIAATNVVPGATTVTVASLSGPGVSTLRTFPAVGPYRVVLWTSAVDAEVVEVHHTSAGPNTLHLTTPAVGNFAIGARVVLLADVVTVSPASSDDHLGTIKYTDRFKFYGPVTQSDSADLIRPQYTSIELSLAPTDFPVTASDAVFNFGNELKHLKTTLTLAASATDTVLTCTDVSQFPITGYPYTVTLGSSRGPLYSEVVHVTNNNGVTLLQISDGLVWDHSPSLDAVEFTPGPEENISYTSRSGQTLTTSPYLGNAHTHQAVEHVAPTVGINFPSHTGFDFPFRLPLSPEERIRLVIDLVRAAGVLVTFITKR